MRTYRPIGGQSKDCRHLPIAGFTLVEAMIVMAILGTLVAIAILGSSGYRQQAKKNVAIADIQALSVAINSYKTDYGVFPNDLTQLGQGQRLDPWGHPYEYLNIADGDKNWKGKCRRDRKLNPINSDFDLYSMGADGMTQKQLTAKESQDDIIRANNGLYVGLEADF